MTQLTDTQINYLQTERQRVQHQEEAQHRAWTETQHRLDTVLDHLSEQNYGLARDELIALGEDLPHDFGAQTFTPMLDRHLEHIETAARRRN